MKQVKDRWIMQDNSGLPRHIGFIMDGNGRWAQKRGLDRRFGHREGAKTFQKIVEYCYELGIPFATFYAFSTENWRRPKEEVDGIMNLLRDYLNRDFTDNSKNVRMRFIGDRSALAQDIQLKMGEIEERTRENSRTTVNLAINYGGRDELVMAMRRLALQVQQGQLSPEEIDADCISGMIYTAGQPDPDCIIRPSGEQRSSNFLLWQSAYAEMVFMDVLWPDFTPAHLDQALEEYCRRNRRFGGI